MHVCITYYPLLDRLLYLPNIPSDDDQQQALIYLISLSRQLWRSRLEGIFFFFHLFLHFTDYGRRRITLVCSVLYSTLYYSFSSSLLALSYGDRYSEDFMYSVILVEIFEWNLIKLPPLLFCS